MSRAAHGNRPDQARIVLEGERAGYGVGLAVLGRVLAGLAETLRAFARSERGQPPRRIGTTTTFDEAVTDLRLVDLERGSLVLVLEEPPAGAEGITASHVAMETLDALLRSAEDRSLPVDVADALERSIAPLGADASIAIHHRGAEIRVRRGEARQFTAPAPHRVDRPLRIVGRLRALDLDRTKIAVRTADGTLWACAYPDALAATVIEAINRVVIADGVGAQAGTGRGQITLNALEIVPEVVQTSLFDAVPRALDELLEAQTVEPGGRRRLSPLDATEEEIEAFLSALGDS